MTSFCAKPQECYQDFTVISHSALTGTVDNDQNSPQRHSWKKSATSGSTPSPLTWPWAGFYRSVSNLDKNTHIQASLVAQWLRVCLPMQGTRVRALVWEDPTCRGATGPVSHNYWACASGACAPQREAAIVRGPRTAMKSGPRLPQLEKALAQKRRPNIAINK